MRAPRSSTAAGLLMAVGAVLSMSSPLRAQGQIGRAGEILIVQGDESILETDGTSYSIRSLPALIRKVIGTVGDHFHTITIWLTFDDRGTVRAEAYEVTVKNDVQGLGPGNPVRDQGEPFGSAGVLRSIVNMKVIGLRAGDTAESWRTALETWGQESAHRWMMYMGFRDPRTGRLSDALLGRDCAHYSQFVDTQASIHDGFAWRDNGDGTFTATERSRRYGNLDLYGMGLLAADEVPPFFFIDEIPGYTYPPCGAAYSTTRRPMAQTISGRRIDVGVADIIAANGERTPTADERQDYWREAEVILTAPNQGLDHPTVKGLAARLDKARLWWEEWNRVASRNRLVMCTQISADCGDPRSDVTALTIGESGPGVEPTVERGPGPVPIQVEVANTGGRTATGVKANLELTIGGEVRRDAKDLGRLDPGARMPVTFSADLAAVPCGTEVSLKATTQSDFHYHRKKTSFALGVETRMGDGFESDSGWKVDPDGNDDSAGAIWERGKPRISRILEREVQPEGAYEGEQAWVTGAAAAAAGGSATFVRQGKTTLQSPLYQSSAFREPLVRFWVSFAGVRADSSGLAIEPSLQSQLVVFARAVEMGDAGVAVEREGWVAVDRLDNLITKGWVRRTARVPVEVLSRSHFQLSFVARDGNPEQGGVEVAIDKLEITSNLPGCYVGAVAPDNGGGGCACRLGQAGARAHRGAAASLVCLLLLGGVLLGRARRRTQAGSSRSSSAAAGSPERSSAR